MKSKIKIAAHNSVPFNVSNHHFCTMGFNSFVPVYCQEVINGDKINANINVFARSTPLHLPNMGNIKMNLSSVYVPFRLVFPWFDNFINGLPCNFGNSSVRMEVVPTIDSYSLTKLFTSSFQVIGQSSTFSLASNARSYDYADFVVSYLDNNDQSSTYGELVDNYFQLTRRGKVILQILHSLGYNFNFVGDNYSDPYDEVNESYSLLPLLCFFKSFVDWFIPSRLQNNSNISRVLNDISVREPNSGQVHIGSNDIANMFYEVYLYYDSDYFTSQWLYPNAPADGLNGFTRFETQGIIGNSVTGDNVPDIPNDIVGQQSARNGTHNNYMTISNNVLTDVGLNLLKKVTSFITRNNLAGSRAVERILARFGVQVPEVQLNYSRFVGRQKVDINVMDVVSQGSDLENLGEYSGKSFIGGSAHFESGEMKERGMFFVFASLDTNSEFIDGQRRYLKHLTPTSFYTPEFDGQNLQAVGGNELIGKLPHISVDNFNVLDSHGFLQSEIFGFQPRYEEYKRQLDVVSGDFDLARYNSNIDGFILPRRFFDVSEAFREQDQIDTYSYYGFLSRQTASSTKIHPTNIVRKDDAQQFHRIYKDTSANYDPYYVHFDCKVTKVSKMIPRDDVWNLSGMGSDVTLKETGQYFN